MAVTIKSAQEIERMRKAGRLLARVHEELAAVIRPGISTKEIDTVCEELIRGFGGTPNFKLSGIPRKRLRFCKRGSGSRDTGQRSNP